MSTPRLPLTELAHALERYGNKYDIFEVFADDVNELYALGNGQELDPALGVTRDGGGLWFSVEGKRYRLELTEKSGMARITQAADAPEPPGDPRCLHRLIASAIARATSAKGEGWLPRLFIGVLAGRFRGPSEGRSVTVRYDAASREWRAYGGPMSQWLRQAAAC